MNKITVFLVIAVMTLGFMVGATMQSKAQSNTQSGSYAGVVPFVTNNDRLGFLDQKSGRIYVYDSNINQCLFIGQINELGKPIQTVSSGNTNISNPAAL